MKATVIMPVYNAAAYLRQAVDSILDQSFRDFEFLIFDDGSTDESRDILRSYDDPRIQLFLQDENTGYISHLNRGLEFAKGEYILRMDADDISLPTRFEKQIDFMEKHPEIGLCGSWVAYIGNRERFHRPPERHEDILPQLLGGTVFIHSSVIIRSGVLKKHDLKYCEDYLYTEDYHLWLKLARLTRLAVIPEVLLRYRVHQQNVSHVHSTRQAQLLKSLRVDQFEDLLGRRLCQNELGWVHFEVNINKPGSIKLIKQLEKQILSVNRTKLIYDPESLRRYLLFRNKLLFKKYSDSNILIHTRNTLRAMFFFPGIAGFASKILLKRWYHQLLKLVRKSFSSRR